MDVNLGREMAEWYAFTARGQMHWSRSTAAKTGIMPLTGIVFMVFTCPAYHGYVLH